MSLQPLSRYRPGTDLLGFDHAPEGVTPELVRLVAKDGPGSRGVLYAKGGEKTVVCIVHPKGDMSRHYLIPAFVDAGFAAFGHESRSPNNDSNMTHEALLADIDAAMRFVRGRGFEKVVCLGYSGGGAAFTFYQAQALIAPPGRLTDTAAGDPFDLNGFDMPPADGFMYAAAHLGTGITMQDELDPSIIDEGDGLSCDPALDMYNPDNGFREPPEESRYAPDFLTRYRAAQRARVARIDAIARDMVATQRTFRAIVQGEGFDRLPLQQRIALQRRAMHGEFLQIHRTTANPALIDLSIDPSRRTLGDINCLRPDLWNYTENGFARILSPKAWLSQWSALSSRSSMLDNLPKVTQPTIVIALSGDNAILPRVSQAIHDTSGATDKRIERVDGDHFGMPLDGQADGGGRAQIAQILVDWLRERFPS
jgi:hypothetical protein